MRQVVLDPEIVSAGIIGRNQPRRLLGLLAFGRWAQVVALLGAAEDALIEEELRRLGGGRGGPPPDELQRLASDRKSALQEMLPYGAADDLIMASSTRLHDAVVERVQLARRESPSARSEAEIGRRARRIAAFLSPVLIGEIGATPSITESLRDHLIHIAALSSAPIVTDDDELAPKEYTFYEHTDPSTGRPAFAIRSWSFVDAHIDVGTFSLGDVPYGLLEVALRGVSA